MAINDISMNMEPESPRGTSPLHSYYVNPAGAVRSIAQSVKFLRYSKDGERLYEFQEDCQGYKKGDIIYPSGKVFWQSSAEQPKTAADPSPLELPIRKDVAERIARAVRGNVFNGKGEKRFYWKFEGLDATHVWVKVQYTRYEGQEPHEMDTEFYEPERPPEKEWYNVVRNTDGGWSYKPNTPIFAELEDLYNG